MQVQPGDALPKIMFARYYGSNLGRFLSVDPGNDTTLLLPQTWNRYAYVRNNPILYNDPKGTCVWDACVGEVIALGALAAATTAVLASPNPGDPSRSNAEVMADSLVEGAKTAVETGKNLVNNLFSKSTGDSGSSSGEQSGAEDSKRHTPDQEAVVELAKEAKAEGGVSADEAGTLVDMAQEAGLPARGPESHPDRKSETSQAEHIHVDKQDHIPVKKDDPKPES